MKKIYDELEKVLQEKIHCERYERFHKGGLFFISILTFDIVYCQCYNLVQEQRKLRESVRSGYFNEKHVELLTNELKRI